MPNGQRGNAFPKALDEYERSKVVKFKKAITQDDSRVGRVLRSFVTPAEDQRAGLWKEMKVAAEL